MLDVAYFAAAAIADRIVGSDDKGVDAFFVLENLPVNPEGMFFCGS